MMGRLATFIGVVTLAVKASVAAPLDQPELAKALDQVLDNDPTARRTSVCLKVVDVESGEVLYDRGGDRLLVPASNLKIYTTACALDTFGPEHCFPTMLQATGPIVDGQLLGDLVLVGGGNAMLTSQELSRLADRVVDQWQLRRVRGRVVVDNLRYNPRLKGPGWMWDDEPDYYNMSITPLMVDFNVLTVRVMAGNRDSIQAELVPPSSYPPVVMLETADAEGDPRVSREPFTESITVTTPEPPGEPFEARLTMNDPAPWVAALFQRMLVDRGVEFPDRPGDAETPVIDSAGPTLVHKGTTLAEAVKHFNKESENAVGEVLLHEIAIANGAKQPTWPDGAKAITEWLTGRAGLEAGSFRLVDGSGLSRYNLISGDSSTKLLVWMKQHEHFDVFFEALPAYEVDLTEIEGPATDLDPADTMRVHAKPGGMTSVSTISGYVRTLDDRLLAFSLLANGYVGSNRPVLDLRGKVWRTLVEYQARQ